jgi:hypothetical protein
MAVANAYNAHWRRAITSPVCYTWCAWRRVDASQTGFIQVTWLGRSGGEGGGIAFALNGSRTVTVFKAGPFTTLWSGPTLAIGTWYWFAIAAQEAAGTDDLRFYWATQGDATITGPILATYNGPWDFQRLGIGGGRPTNESNALYGRISWAHEKVWLGPSVGPSGDNALLTTSELQDEYESGPPVSKLAVNPSYWNDDDGLDITQALDLTLVAGTGSVSETDDPLGTAASEVDATPSSLSLEAAPLSPTPGAVTVTLTPALLSLDAPALDAAPTPVAVDLAPATVDLAAVPVAPAPGVVSVNLTPAGLSLTAVALEPSGDVVTVALTPASIEIAAPSLDATPGAVVVALAPALVSLAAVALMDTGAVDITVVLGSPRLRNTAVLAGPRQGTTAGQPRTKWAAGEPRTAVTAGAPRIDRSN